MKSQGLRESATCRAMTHMCCSRMSGERGDRAPEFARYMGIDVVIIVGKMDDSGIEWDNLLVIDVSGAGYLIALGLS